MSDEASAVVVTARTVWLSVVLVLAWNAVVPLYVAVIGWLPTASVEVVNVAWPEPLRVTLDASAVAPSLNVTVPAVTGLPPLVTVAVNVTVWPNVDGLGDEVSAVVVAAAVAMLRHHPPPIVPVSPVASSNTYRLHTPLGLVPLKAPASVVAADTAGAPGSVSPLPALVGLNDPDEIDAVGIPVAALSAKVRVTVGGSVGAGWRRRRRSSA